MSNPFQHGPSGTNPDVGIPSYLPPIRSSSYASVVSGSNPGLATSTHSPFNRISRLSYLLNPSQDSPSDLYSTNIPSRNHIMDTDMNGSSPDGGASILQPRAPQLPPFSRAFEMYMNNGNLDSIYPHRNNGFFTPSYLRGSSYIQKLEEAHKAKQAQKENHHQRAGSGLQAGSTPGSLTNKTPASHLGMTYDLIERAPVFDEEDAIAPLPTRWNNDDKYGGLEVTANGQEVKYISTRSSRDQEHEVCAIRADHPMPTQAGIYYFEVSLLSTRRDETTVSIGFSGKNVPLSRPPGWEPDSWGYHGDDGDIYSGHNVGKTYEAQTFGPPDTVGCGVNFRTGEAFFTKNGQKFKAAFRDVKGKLYPTVGMKKSGEHIRVNFGQTPFVFNIDNIMRREQESIKAAISKTSIENLVSPPMDGNDLIQQLVLQFLQHDGYVETARAFAEEIHAEKQALVIDPKIPIPGVNIKDDEDANRRQRIRRAVLEGDIEKAIKHTNDDYPLVLKINVQVYFRLRCQAFIEMVRKSAEVNSTNAKKSNGHAFGNHPNKMDIDENGFSDQMEEDASDSELHQEAQDLYLERAVEYGQSLQAEFKNDTRPEIKKALNEVFSLLAYPNPLQVKEVAPLLDRKSRVAVAEELNSAILSALGKSSRSALENLYGQTSVLLDYLREDGGPGSLVTIQAVIDEIPS
ncbi:SPRY domain-containing protein [Whalleya microplaca]|nr:SPRY domain-containing protein [Whalleya microplaca]